MADRIITVTDPSVVTNDTLSGYNNYSDIDGQLGTTMTPTEATNGHTVALSDGVVHEVTTKPVGTTNGEFTGVVSNVVEVDLSGGGGTPIIFTQNTGGITESPTEIYQSSSTTFSEYAATEFAHAGDFDYQILVDDAATDKGMIIWAKLSASFGPWNSASTWGIEILDTAVVGAIRGGAREALDTPTTLTWQSGDVMRLRRVGEVCTILLNTTVIHTFSTEFPDAMWLYISPQNGAAGYRLRYPRLV